MDNSGENLLDRFVEQRLAGLEEKERTELFRRLEADPAFREAFRERVEWEADLWRMGQEGGFSQKADHAEAPPQAMQDQAGSSPASAQATRPAGRRTGKGRVGYRRRVSAPSSNGRWVSALIAASVLIGAGYVYVRSNEPEANLARLGADTIVVRGGKRIQPSVGYVLQQGDLIETAASGKGSGTTIRYSADATRVVIGPGSRVVMDSRGGKRLQLKQGRLQAWVAPQQKDQPMIILAADAQVEVLGTRFDLLLRSERTLLGVSKGSVRFTRPERNEQVSIQGGEFAWAEAGKPVRTGKLSLIGWWKLDGNLKDSSRTEMDGTFKGTGKAQYVNGRSGKALKLQGDDQHVWIPENPLWDTGSTRTMACWFRTEKRGTDNKGGALNSSKTAVYFNPYSGLIQTKVSLKGEEGGFKFHTDPKFPDNRWHHVVFVYDRYAKDLSKRMVLYYDGKPVHTDRGADADLDEGGPLTLGYFNKEYCAFAFDDVALFHIALTPQQVGALYDLSKTPGNLIESSK